MSSVRSGAKQSSVPVFFDFATFALFLLFGLLATSLNMAFNYGLAGQNTCTDDALSSQSEHARMCSSQGPPEGAVPGKVFVKNLSEEVTDSMHTPTIMHCSPPPGKLVQYFTQFGQVAKASVFYFDGPRGAPRKSRFVVNNYYCYCYCAAYNASVFASLCLHGSLTMTYA